MNKQAMKIFLKSMAQIWPISCVIILASLVCFPCFNSVSYDFHCLILSKQTTNIIIAKILTAIMQYNFIYKKL